MKKLILLSIVIMISCSKERKRDDLSTVNTDVLKKELSSYLIYCNRVFKNPSFEYGVNEDYIEILNYRGSYDSIFFVKRKRDEIEMIKKAVNLYKYGVYSCSVGDEYILFGINKPDVNMLTNLNEYRYVGFLNDSIVKKESFINYFKIIDKKDSLYYIMNR